MLVEVDDSGKSTRAVETALTSFAAPRIVVLHILDPTEPLRYIGLEGNVVTDFEEIRGQRKQEAEELLDGGEKLVNEHQ